MKMGFKQIIKRLDQDMGYFKDQDLTLMTEIFKR